MSNLEDQTVRYIVFAILVQRLGGRVTISPG